MDRVKSNPIPLAFSLVLFALIIYCGYSLFIRLVGTETDVLIPRGASLQSVITTLREEGVVSHPLPFKILLRLTGGQSHVQAGEYHFYRGDTLAGALWTLYFSKPVLHSVTIPEGWNVRQIAKLLASSRLVNEKSFVDKALSAQYARKFGLTTPHLEGFLYPDTYSLSRIDGEDRILEQMVQHFLTVYRAEFKQQGESQGWPMERVVTLASIVEKETGAAHERPVIASVFHNRLRQKMKLQSDPTTIYGIVNFDGNLTKRHLLTSTPYNTYTIPALPPGPIASPGRDSIRAVLNPATTEFLYFVANNNGSHIFSKSYGEHARHVDHFQKRIPLSNH